MPRSLRRSTERFLSRIRKTHFSPQMVATVATRTSVSFPSMVVVNWPSWERRFSTMLISAMILIRLISPTPMVARERQDVLERTVDPEADVNDVLRGLDVDVGGPVAHRLGQNVVDHLHDRCVVGDNRRSLRLGGGSLARPSTASNACTSLPTLTRAW